jgi:hypothetical protein
MEEMAMLKPKMKLVPITDEKESEMKKASETVNRQRKSPIEMPDVIASKEKKGYR